MKRGAEVITDPQKARVLVDPMRREMVRLLAERPMTENELAGVLGLSDPSVGHHLKILRDAGLIKIARKEIEEHGILQKFYETNALAYFVDGRKMPLEIERYFMPVGLERARGIIAAMNTMTTGFEVIVTKELEEFARLLSAAVVQAALKYSRNTRGDREEVIGRIYRDALAHLLSTPQTLPTSVNRLLLATHK
jgi:DNA-binding transcriptional ArsR family regulator